MPKRRATRPSRIVRSLAAVGGKRQAVAGKLLPPVLPRPPDRHPGPLAVRLMKWKRTLTKRRLPTETMIPTGGRRDFPRSPHQPTNHGRPLGLGLGLPPPTSRYPLVGPEWRFGRPPHSRYRRQRVRYCGRRCSPGETRRCCWCQIPLCSGAPVALAFDGAPSSRPHGASSCS